jgi:DNA polymerase III sliding clamp (beta) subunit (PCNA family)
MELCHALLGFITKSSSPEDLGERILGHLSREEYQRLLDKLERRKSLPEPVGTLKISASEGEVELVGRFNSHFLLDAFRAMTGNTAKIRYRMDRPVNVTIRPVLLEDDTDNVHLFMPMKVD